MNVDRELTHIGAEGRARMVDVTEKAPSVREATAEGFVRMEPETLRLILSGGVKKGDVLAVASGACYSWVFMLNKLPGGNPVWATILGQLIGVGIGLPSLVQETQFDGTSLFYGVLLGVFQLGLAYVCLTTGIRYVKPITASLVTGIEPVLNPILVALVVGEVLTPLALLGGAIVFVSVMVYNVLNLRLEKQRAAVPTQEPDLPSRKE